MMLPPACICCVTLAMTVLPPQMYTLWTNPEQGLWDSGILIFSTALELF